MFTKREAQYASLSSDSMDEVGSTTNESHTKRSALTFRRLLTLIVLLSGSLISFFAGKHFGEKNHWHSASTIQLDIAPKVLLYQRPFADDPALRKDDIWDSMFPNNGTKGGYFSHPDIAPTRSTFSVFHQLHCLHAIREAYYNAVNTSEARHSHSSHSDMASHTSPAHIRHCIDLIRQSLMCNADTTIEVKDEKINGVRGFGTEHQCRDWDGLVRWTEETQKKYGMGEEPIMS